MQDLSRFTEALLAAAMAEGAGAADAIATEGRSLSIDVRNGQLEQAERSEGVDIGLRVLIGQRQACVSASDTSSDTIQALAERAVAMARLAPEDPNIGLADPNQLADNIDTSILDLVENADEPAPADLQEIAARTESQPSPMMGSVRCNRHRPPLVELRCTCRHKWVLRWILAKRARTLLRRNHR